ncbi:hypothetical protein F5884DRAFT_849452 [Xylogone sp. PMI_703]|nr:hypothetical protein F5884DRAFT_849452 [Xylogone sp. PMI_703]
MPKVRRSPVSAASTNFSSKEPSTRKRDRYVLHACNRCKAAKVRCDGELPCSYCVPRDPDSCHYNVPRFEQEYSQEKQTRNDDINRLTALVLQQNDKLDKMMQRISSVEEIHRIHYAQQKYDPVSSSAEDPLPLFQSSFSAFCCIRVMDTSLRANGSSTSGINVLDQTDPQSPPTSFSIFHGQIVDEVPGKAADGDGEEPAPVIYPSNTSLGMTQTSKDKPLSNLERSEVIRLIRVYQDWAGMMYPFVDVASMERQVRDLFATDICIDAHDRNSNQLSQIEFAILQMMVATALVIEDHGDRALVRNIHSSIWPDVESMVWNTKVDLKGLVLLTLMAVFFYYSHKSRMGWRLLSNITRIILELGLNREIVLNRSFTDREKRAQAVNTIWTVVILEKQLRYSLGLSMVTHDLRLDQDFPKPIDAPYLEAMIQYSRIGAYACDTLLGEKTSPDNIQEIFSYFQYRLDEWQKAIGSEFQFKSGDERINKWNEQLRTILYLRANNLRIVILRFLILESGGQGSVPLDPWASSIDVATDTCHILASLDSLPSTCRFQKSQSNYFLVAALGILLLAICQDTSVPVSPSYMGREISMAHETYLKAQQSAILCLNILYNRAKSCRLSRCMWERVRGLASHLNLLVPSTNLNSGHSAYMMEGGSNGSILNHIDVIGSQEPVSNVPIPDLSFFASLESVEDSISAIDMVSGLDMMFDPAFLSGGLDQ